MTVPGNVTSQWAPLAIGATEIYLMNADGSNVVQHTFTGSRSENPAWSPDGRQIVNWTVSNGWRGNRRWVTRRPGRTRCAVAQASAIRGSGESLSPPGTCVHSGRGVKRKSG